LRYLNIVLVILIEMALITPPVGLNLFVVQSLRSRGSLNDVMIGSLPFVVAMLVMILLLGFFPGIAMWLPGLVG
jgi:TRAP-type C4-dicarboxylate transport system permease large subunit